jgi:hypothetical protein
MISSRRVVQMSRPVRKGSTIVVLLASEEPSQAASRPADDFLPFALTLRGPSGGHCVELKRRDNDG